MAVLTEADRAELAGELMRALSTENEAVAITKPVLRAALDAADAWVEANAVAYNQALPLEARTALTAKQKARLLMFVIRQRYVRS